MAEELQSLLEKIRNDGIKKAEAERDQIISQAQAEAAQIIKAAEEKEEDPEEETSVELPFVPMQ